MGCSCTKNSQIGESINPIIKEEEEKEENEDTETSFEEEEFEGFEEIEEIKEIKEDKIQEEQTEEKRIEIIDPLKFDFHRARKIVKLCLSKDNLYGKFLDYVLSFNKKQFEQIYLKEMKIIKIILILIQ